MLSKTVSQGLITVHLFPINEVGDSINEVYCNVAVKLSGNITVHTLLGNVLSVIYSVKVFL